MKIIRLPGFVPYLDGLALQRQLVSEVQAGNSRGSILILQHSPVYTIGRREHHLYEELQKSLLSTGTDIVKADRGGQVTWHGPGQLVVYPILNLADARSKEKVRLGPSIRDYVALLEDCMIAALKSLGLSHGKLSARPFDTNQAGVWVSNKDALTGPSKIGFVGIRNQRWIVSHGFSLNITNSLEPFSHIIPCGMVDCKITNLASELGDSNVDADLLKEAAEVIETVLLEKFNK